MMVPPRCRLPPPLPPPPLLKPLVFALKMEAVPTATTVAAAVQASRGSVEGVSSPMSRRGLRDVRSVTCTRGTSYQYHTIQQ